MSTFHVDMLALAVTPGILISACGVVTTALYNRLGVILARIRGYHQRKIEVLVGHPQLDMLDLQSLLDMLDAQIAAVTAKAKMIQNGLCCLLGAIVALLLCTVFAGFAVVFEWFGPVALATGFLAVCLFIVGLGWGLREVLWAMSPLEEETAYLEVLRSQHVAKSQERAKPEILKRAG